MLWCDVLRGLVQDQRMAQGELGPRILLQTNSEREWFRGIRNRILTSSELCQVRESHWSPLTRYLIVLPIPSPRSRDQTLWWDRGCAENVQAWVVQRLHVVGTIGLTIGFFQVSYDESCKRLLIFLYWRRPLLPCSSLVSLFPCCSSAQWSTARTRTRTSHTRRPLTRNRTPTKWRRPDTEWTRSTTNWNLSVSPGCICCLIEKDHVGLRYLYRENKWEGWGTPTIITHTRFWCANLVPNINSQTLHSSCFSNNVIVG